MSLKTMAIRAIDNLNLTIKDLPGNEELFFKYLDKLEKSYKGKNLDWIPYLKRDWEKYIFWTLCFKPDTDDLVAFSCIQDHFFEPGVVRILTRTWFDPDSRFKHGALWSYTPVAPMAKAQIEWLGTRDFYTKAIFTLEHFRDYRVLEQLANKINKRTGITRFTPKKDLIKTHPWQEEQEYQRYAEHILIHR